MDKLYTRCVGIDVHKRMIMVCLLCGRKKTIRSFSTDSRELRDMAKWLEENHCQAAAMESTGSYWKPLYNILELLLPNMKLVVANAQHMRNVPGRKTDVRDAEWIAKLLKQGLLKPSFIPDREQRELRELSRYRKSLVEERAREINRLQKILEGGNIKLGNYVSHITGKTAGILLRRIVENDHPLQENEVSRMLHPSMKHGAKEIMQSLDGMLSPIQKDLIRKIMDHIDDMTKRITEMDDTMTKYMGKYQKAIERLCEISGIAKRSAETILIETGLDMTRFPNAGCLCRWSGLAPGNNESAQKRRSGRITKGNNTLKTIMIQCAKIAKRKTDSFFHAQYNRIVVRRGSNRATVAVAHSMLIAIYHMLRDDQPFKDLGGDYYNQFNREKKMNYHLKQLYKLGWIPGDPQRQEATSVS